MRKIALFASLILAITLLLLLVGCGGKDSGENTQGANTETDTGTDTPTPDEKSETEKKIYALADAYSNKDLTALADLVYSNAKGKELFLGANTAENYFEGYISLKINSVTELYNDGRDAGYTVSAKLKYSDVDNDGNEVEGETDVSGSVYLVKNDGNWYFTEMPNLDFMKKTLSTRENDGAEYYYGEYFYSVSPVRVNDETKKITIAFDNNLPSTVNVSKYFRSYGDASIKFGYESVGGFTESGTAFIPSGSTKAYHMLVVEADGEEITYDIVILKKEPVTVTFYDYEGEEVIKSVQLMQFEKVEAPEDYAEFSGFAGWRDSRGNEFDFTSRVESSMDLYASFITDSNKELIEKIDSYKGKEITEDDKSDIYALYETYSALDDSGKCGIYNRYTLEEIYGKAVAFDWKVSMDYSTMKYTVVEYTGTELKVKIPSQVNGVEVVSIQQEAFDGKELDELVIPDSIVRIPVRIFGSGFAKEVFCLGDVEYTDDGWMKDCFKSDDGRVSEVYEYFVEKRTEDGILYYLVTNEPLAPFGEGFAIAKSVQTDATEIVIPEFIAEGKFRVSRVGKDLFKGRDDLKKVVLPGVKIESGAFEGCTSLDELVIGDSTAEDGAFANCKAKSVAASAALIPLFSDADVETFYIYGGDSTVTISFEGYTSLVEVVFNSSSPTYYIGDGAFSNITSLKRFIVEQEGEQGAYFHLGKNVFDGCTSIEKVEAPLNVIQAIPKDSLTEAKIMVGYYESVTIASTTFENATLLKKVEITDLEGSNITIDDGAFSDCLTIESIILPTSVTSISSSALYLSDGSAVPEIQFQGTMSQWKDVYTSWSQLQSDGCTVICSDGTI
ncbi:MAG: leucine-rich repeat protein [Eubacteriales bacterium]